MSSTQISFFKNRADSSDSDIQSSSCFRTVHLDAGYHGRSFVKDINIQIERGQILTLIGPNGAGKSTILKTLTGQLPAVSGEMFLKGKTFTSYSRLERVQIMAVMMTDSIKTEHMTGREVVETGRYPYTGSFGLLSARDHAAVRKALQTTRAEELADQDFMSLSDGQKQRVRLAAALAQEPELLVLDEPTSWLDIRYQLELLDILQELCTDRGVAVIMSLHELFLAERVSDFIICVKNGRIDRAGTVRDVFSDHYIDDLYDLMPGTYAALHSRT